MEKRIGVVCILINSKDHVDHLNSLISQHSEIIQGRIGLPFREKKISVIALIVEGTTNQISAMTGQIGRLSGIQVKSLLTNYKEAVDGKATEDCGE